MNKYTTEQIEASLQRSLRPEQPIAGKAKQAFLENLFRQPQPWYRRFWQLWLVVPVAGAAVAGVVWYVATQQPTPATQLANTTLPVNMVNVEPDQTQLVNADASVEPNLLASTALLPRYNQINQYFYGGLGGDSGFDYSVTQFVNASNQTSQTSQATVQERARLSNSELIRLAAFFPIAPDKIQLEDFNSTNCSSQFLGDTTQSCLSLVGTGLIHYRPGTSTFGGLDATQQLISTVTGLPVARYMVEDLGVLPDLAEYHHYHLYNQDSLTEHILYRDIGWDVYLHNGQLYSLRGYVLPQLQPGQKYTLISPAEAFSRLQAGFKPLDRTSNPNTTRLDFNFFFLAAIAKANSQPTLTVESINLEYSLAVNDTTLQLIPVYYVRATDQTSHLHLDMYIDPTQAGNLFHDLELLNL